MNDSTSTLPMDRDTVAAIREVQLEGYKLRYLASIEMTKAAIEFAKLTIQSMTIISAGAIATTLTLIAAVLPRTPAVAKSAGDVLTLFVWSMSLALICGGLSYVSQSAYASVVFEPDGNTFKPNKPRLLHFGIAVNVAAMVVFAASLGLLLLGGLRGAALISSIKIG